MTITVNGEATSITPDATVHDLLLQLGLPDQGIAVAVDGAVVPRGRWGQGLVAGAQIEIVTAVQGG